ncbi:MAG TPA: thiamine pyrophosphate-dependent enzyme [Dehalococcoidales bacterium]|nr:thiamine pyrophosphate-dependent enzyme [Dehalococcoidales bacterium]
MAVYECSDLFIEVLNAEGVEYIFYNPGFDVVPLLSAAARYRAAGKPAPVPIMCLDEFTALNAAHGNYMVSGRPQVLLVHAELGTQQVGGAIQQAAYGRVPVIICAADMTLPGRLNWRGEPYDPGAMLRNCVKWDHKVGNPAAFYEALRAAFQKALSGPTGPVYLTYPVDLLTKQAEVSGIQKSDLSGWEPVDNVRLETAAEILLQAENPLVMTGYSGRNPSAVSSLVELAEILGARVVTSPVRMNFPSDHPLCANLEPNDGLQSRPYFLSSDAVLVIDYDIPYAHPRTQPRAETRFIHIDTDFTKQGEMLWSRKPDVAIQGDSAAIIPLLSSLVRRRLSSEMRLKIQKRVEKITAEQLQVRQEYKALAEKSGGAYPISPEWLAYCINRVVDREAVIVNQTIMPSGSVARQVKRTKAGTLLGCAGGTIGWALGAALGAKVGSPDKMVVALMGDGAFIYGGPEAALWPAKYYKAPFLTVIFNNQAYGAIKMLFQGRWKEGIENSTINPPPVYAEIAQACGAFGRTVDKPEDVIPALQEAVQKVRAGQAAVVDVRTG